MIKRIIVKRLEDIKTPLDQSSFNIGITNLINATIATSTSAIEENVIKYSEQFITKGSQNAKYAENYITISSNLDLYLVNRASFEDFLAVLKHGDIAAKKRLLKELEGI